MKGYRVISIAYKEINDLLTSRDQVEKDLNFSGFIMFINPLKSDSAKIIDQLN